MPLVIGKDPGGVEGAAVATDPKGVTAELIAAFLYARHNGAHVANLSAGGDYFKAVLLNNHTVVDPEGLRLIPGNRGLTMRNLP